MILLVALLLAVTLLTLFIFLTFSIFIIDFFLDLPYVGTNKNKMPIILEFANIKKGDTAVDLGSGDGRILIAAAQRGAYAIGYEKNPLLILLSRFHSKIKGVRGEVEIKNESFWQSDLKIADVIFVYAFIKTMPKFEKYIYQNAKKGTRIVVNTNPFPNKKPKKSQNGIFLYIT